MKRYAPWLLLTFLFALLLPLGLCADRPTRVFLDSPIGRASYLDLSRRLFVPTVAIMVPVVMPGKFWLHLEARRRRTGPDQSLPLRSNFSFDHALLLRAHGTGPPWIDLCGHPNVGSSGSAVKVARPAHGPPEGGNYPSETAKYEAPAKIGVLQRVILTTGFS